MVCTAVLWGYDKRTLLSSKCFDDSTWIGESRADGINTSASNFCRFRHEPDFSSVALDNRGLPVSEELL